MLTSLARIVGLAAFLVALAACPPVAAAEAPARPAVLGINTAGFPGELGTGLDGFAERSGAMPGVAMYFQDWYEGWSTALVNPRFVSQADSRGVVPMITWEPSLATGGPVQPAYALANIARGDFDAYVRRAAREARDYGRPLLLRFAHEMNGSWYPWGSGVAGNTADSYVAAWRRVVEVFRAEGATNVRWVWSPNVWGYNGADSALPFYPGDDYVDWVGLDGYNWGSAKGSGWRSFTQVFQSSYDALAGLTAKPMMIAETASAEAGGDKAQWIRTGLLEDLPARMPRVRLVVWFDRNKEVDWRVESSPSALAAFRQVSADPRYSGSGASLFTPPVVSAPPTPGTGPSPVPTPAQVAPTPVVEPTVPRTVDASPFLSPPPVPVGRAPVPVSPALRVDLKGLRPNARVSLPAYHRSTRVAVVTGRTDRRGRGRLLLRFASATIGQHLRSTSARLTIRIGQKRVVVALGRGTPLRRSPPVA